MQHDHQRRGLLQVARNMQNVVPLGLIYGDGPDAVFSQRAPSDGPDETEQRQNKTGRAKPRPAGLGLHSEDQAASDFL